MSEIHMYFKDIQRYETVLWTFLFIYLFWTFGFLFKDIIVIYY